MVFSGIFHVASNSLEVVMVISCFENISLIPGKEENALFLKIFKISEKSNGRIIAKERTFL